MNDKSDNEWDRLRDKLWHSLAPAEERVASKLKARIVGAKSPLALETEFRRYSELTKRETIKTLLRPERQQLLAAYTDLIGIHNIYIIYTMDKIKCIMCALCRGAFRVYNPSAIVMMIDV